MSRERRLFSRTEREALALLAGGHCEQCGDPLTRDTVEADHRIPWSHGGPTTMENGAALCRTCNRKKGAHPPGEDEHKVSLDTGHRPQEPAYPVFAPTPGFNDRTSQIGFMSSFVGSWMGLGKRHFLAEMGTGSGKTACGVSAAQHLFDVHRAELAAGVPRAERRGARLAIVFAHTTAIKSEWELEFARLQACGGPRIEVRQPMGVEWDGIPHLGKPAEYSAIIVSPQALESSVVRMALKAMIGNLGNEVAVIVDEVHHCARENTWGSCVDSAAQAARVLVGLSGTPFRHDDGAILGLESEVDGAPAPDYRYTKAQALADGVVAPLNFMRVESELRESEQASGRLLRKGKLSESDGEIGSDFLRIVLGPNGQTLERCIREGARMLTAVRATDQGPVEAAGAIQCATVTQLRAVRSMLEKMGYQVMVTHQNDGQDPGSVIHRFREGEGDWLLGIHRLTEGLNVKRLRVGVNVNFNAKTRANFIQFAARMERLVAGIPPEDQTGYIVIPRFPQWEKFALEYEADMSRVEEIRKLPTFECGGCGKTIPKSAACCPYCEAPSPHQDDRTPWKPAQEDPEPTTVEETAWYAGFIHQARALDPEEIEVLAGAWDARCRAAGVPATHGLGLEMKAARELRARAAVDAAA